jgi:hypothetical protein
MVNAVLGLGNNLSYAIIENRIKHMLSGKGELSNHVKGYFLSNNTQDVLY